MSTSLRNRIPSAAAGERTIQRPVEEVTTVEVCDVCGESRELAVFYQSDCRAEGEWIQGRFIPGPSLGEHRFIRVTLDEATYGRKAAS